MNFDSETMDERISRLNAEKRHPSTSPERAAEIERRLTQMLFDAIVPRRTTPCPGSIPAPRFICGHRRTR